jgi:hypothetical protein
MSSLEEAERGGGSWPTADLSVFATDRETRLMKINNMNAVAASKELARENAVRRRKKAPCQ